MNKIIIIIVIFIAAVGLFFGLVFPKYQSLMAKYSEAEVKKTNLANESDYYKKVAKIAEQLKAYSEQLTKIDSALPAEVSLPQMYDFFQKRISESGLSRKSIEDSVASSNKDLAGLKEHHFNMELAGSYENFKNFLSILEKSARIIEVEKVSFTSPEKKDEAFSFSVSVKFYSY
jgi:Tfp pilus assembly protein PilO